MQLRVVAALSFALTLACEKAVPAEIVNPIQMQPPPLSGDGDGDGDADDEPGILDDAGAGDAGGGMDAGEPPPEPFTKRGLLKAAAACAVAHYDAFATDASRLREATQAWAADPSDEKRSAVRDAWRVANARWQRAELFRFGPAARAMDDPGGSDLRDVIYAFPQNNACLIDQRIVDRKYATDFASILIGARGLNSVEYLSFYGSESNSCGSFISINAQGTWAALGADEVNRRRAAYADAALADVMAKSNALRDAWAESGGNFVNQMTAPGSGKVYASEQAALNAVSHGLFYLEKEIKDWKLGLPLGLTDGCTTTTCPNLVESRYAKVSTDNLRQNLVGFRKLFEGCGSDDNGLGFDDWLVAVGAEDLNARMLAALEAAQQAVDDLDPPVEEAIVSAPDKLLAVHAAVKKLNDLLKTEFVSTLDLELPMGAEGDND
jgi:predicted lipoprotein